MITVPDFFQDESEAALRFQVEWQKQHLGLGDRFFARLLCEDQRRFTAWASDAQALPPDKEEVLRDWWRTVLHLLSFQNFEEEKVRALLVQTATTPPRAGQVVFSQLWSGSSLADYLENHGAEAIPEVNRWLESFRFGDPYASPPKGSTCLSTQP